MTATDSKMRCVVVDDEPHIRRRIAKLAAAAGLEVAGLAENGADGERLIRDTQPDIAFIDIRMPVMSGLELASMLRTMDAPPAVVFVTAYGDHALAAFELSAIDYVVKPLDPGRFFEAVAKAQSAAMGWQARAALTRLDEIGTSGKPRRLTFRSGSALVTASPAEIAGFRAMDDYVEVRLAGETYLLSTTMNALERILPAAVFLRVHRSHIVNIGRVRVLERAEPGRLVLRMIDGSVVPVSRGRSPEARRVFG